MSHQDGISVSSTHAIQEAHRERIRWKAQGRKIQTGRRNKQCRLCNKGKVPPLWSLYLLFPLLCLTAQEKKKKQSNTGEEEKHFEIWRWSTSAKVFWCTFMIYLTFKSKLQSSWAVINIFSILIYHSQFARETENFTLKGEKMRGRNGLCGDSREKGMGWIEEFRQRQLVERERENWLTLIKWCTAERCFDTRGMSVIFRGLWQKPPAVPCSACFQAT